VVRFITVSRSSQIIASLLLLVFLIWVAITTYSYVMRAQILAAKDRELVATERKYDTTNSQFATLKNNIEKSAKTLEQRQIYLQQLLDTDKSLSAGNVTDHNESGGKADKPRKKRLAPANSYDTSSISGRAKLLVSLQVSIARIGHQQQALAESMIDRISSKIAYVETTLKESGIGSRKLIQLSKNRPSMAMGGPFILYSGKSNPEDFSDNEPFAKLYSNHNRLIDLENAVRHIPVGRPIRKYYVSSGFGVRKDPFNKKWAYHYGLDMAGWWRTPIYATANGIVMRAGRNGAYGNFVEINHGNGFRTRYGHLYKIEVKKGDYVTLGQEIGRMGSTGRSTSPHLHYEIRFNGKPINPMKIFKATSNVLKIQRQEYGN